MSDVLTPKQRYFEKKYREAGMISCACGCGEQLKCVDKYARPAKYVNGHNTRISNDGTNLTNWQREKRWRVKNPEAIREAKQKFYNKRKILAVELKGSECIHCGLKHDGKNHAVFDFHHLDPEYKEQNISKMLINKAWKGTLLELEKCVLLCANCHRLEHHQED
jgi:hypothetical protein